MREGWKDYGVEKTRRSGLLIGLNGVAQSGKDTVGRILCTNHGFQRLSFADALKTGLYEVNPIVTWKLNKPDFIPVFFTGESNVHPVRLKDIVDKIGWDEAKFKYNEVRELLQRYGTEGGRNVHGDNCWISIIEKIILDNPNTNYVITDARFPNELTMVVRRGGHKVHVAREGYTSVNSHVSDAVLDTSNFDFGIRNDSTIEDLERRINDLIMDISPIRHTQAAKLPY